MTDSTPTRFLVQLSPAHWRAVIRNMAGAVKRDGAIILAEDLPLTSPIRYSNYVLHRTLGETRAAFLALGMLLDPGESENPFHLARPRVAEWHKLKRGGHVRSARSAEGATDI